MAPVFVLISQKIINRFVNIHRPFKASLLLVFTRPVGAGYNLNALSGLRLLFLQFLNKIDNYIQTIAL
jgi:hypothetical protein